LDKTDDGGARYEQGSPALEPPKTRDTSKIRSRVGRQGGKVETGSGERRTAFGY